IEIDHQHTSTSFCQRGGDIQRAGGLGGAALLIEKGDAASHRSQLHSCMREGPSVRTDAPCTVAWRVGLDKQTQPLLPFRANIKMPETSPECLVFLEHITN